MTTAKDWLHGLLVFCLLVILYSIYAMTVRAQEKPARETRQWQLGQLPEAALAESAWMRVPAVRVDVFDTEGVCLYVTRNYMASDNWHVNTVAVPKTQLPKGTGCQ